MSAFDSQRQFSKLVCPGLFYGVPAQDGLIVRVRIPGGNLAVEQAQGLLDLAADLGTETLQITNRANLQLRGITHLPSSEILAGLQRLGLASSNPAVDVLRNIMLNPLAGRDATELFDFSCWLPELEHFFATHPGLEHLPAKFSIGLDGGGQCSIGQRSANGSEHRYNEIQLTARPRADVGLAPSCDPPIFLELTFGIEKQRITTGILVQPEYGLALLKALIQAYADYCQAPDCSPKTRLREILTQGGVAAFLHQAQQYFDFPLLKIPDLPPPAPHPGQQYLGVQAQSQQVAHLGVGLPQGQLTTKQFRGLVELAQHFGSGRLSLTPWHSVFLTNIPNPKIPQVITELESLGLSISPQIAQGIVACTGKLGCAAAHTDTQTDAQRLGDYLAQELDTPLVNIHLTACPKACAQPSAAEITLLGLKNNTYRLYAGDLRDPQAPVIAEHSLEQLFPLIRAALKSKRPCPTVTAP